MRAALLVAVPEPGGSEWPEVAHSFAAVPLAPLGFSSLVVASHDDLYGSFDYASKCAKAWAAACTMPETPVTSTPKAGSVTGRPGASYLLGCAPAERSKP